MTSQRRCCACGRDDAPVYLPADRYLPVPAEQWGDAIVCPTCWSSGRGRPAIGEGLAYVLLVFGWAWAVSRDPLLAAGQAGVVACGYYAATVLYVGAIVLTARLCGWAVGRVCIGYGRRLARRVGVPIVELRSRLGWDYNVCPTDPAYPRWQWTVVNVAGVVATTAAAGSLWLAWDSRWAPLLGSTIAAVGVLWFVCYPSPSGMARVFRNAGRPEPNEVPGWLAGCLAGPLALSHREDEAMALLERAIAADPNDLAARTMRASSFAGIGRMDEAIAEFQRLLAGHDATEPAAFMLWNDAAYFFALSGRADLLLDALTLARRAISTAPHRPAVQGTLALTLVLWGHVEDGAAMARRCRRDDRMLGTSSAFTLAIAAARAGDLTAARTWLRKAGHAPEDQLVRDLAEREIVHGGR